MLDKPISPLRQRTIDDMTARRVKEKVRWPLLAQGLVKGNWCQGLSWTILSPGSTARRPSPRPDLILVGRCAERP
jgi:hypothetical protein